MTLVVRWLPAVDVFAASCVSSDWRASLVSDQDNGELWKQVCRNSFPLMLALDENNAMAVDYRLLTFGLLDPDRRTIHPVPTTETPQFQSRLSPEDLFAVVDLCRMPLGTDGRKQREIVATWICPVGADGTIDTNSSEQGSIMLKGENPYSASNLHSEEVEIWKGRATERETAPHEYAAWNMLGASWFGGYCLPLGLRVTLFRRHDMKSTCVMDRSTWEWSTAPPREGEHVVNYKTSDADHSLHFANNDEGCRAKAMMYDYQSSRLDLTGVLTAMARLPPRGSEAEALWLANCRRKVAARRKYIPNSDDVITLSNISHFEFNVSLKMALQLCSISDGVRFDFPRNSDVMVALEGLRWK